MTGANRPSYYLVTSTDGGSEVQQLAELAVEMLATISEWLDEHIELWKLLASITLAIIAALVAIYVTRSGILANKVEAIDPGRLTQRLRLAIYMDLAPRINEIFYFITCVGPWNTLSPEILLDHKRHCDKEIGRYRSLFKPALFDAYRDFIEASFEDLPGFGQGTKIRLDVSLAKKHWQERWNTDWERAFSHEKVQPGEVSRAHERFMRLFASELGADGCKQPDK